MTLWFRGWWNWNTVDFERGSSFLLSINFFNFAFRKHLLLRYNLYRGWLRGISRTDYALIENIRHLTTAYKFCAVCIYWMFYSVRACSGHLPNKLCWRSQDIHTVGLVSNLLRLVTQTKLIGDFFFLWVMYVTCFLVVYLVSSSLPNFVRVLSNEILKLTIFDFKYWCEEFTAFINCHNCIWNSHFFNFCR